MKAQKKKSHSPDDTQIHDGDSSLDIYRIAVDMGKAHLPKKFIDQTVQTALAFEGVYDLMKLWDEESSSEEREEIIADIQDMIDECSQKEKVVAPYIRFDDLDRIASDIRKFKDSLRLTVDKHGGLKNLSEKTDIPIQSLSRFFNSASMPQRLTLLKIAEALKLDGVQVATEWAR